MYLTSKAQKLSSGFIVYIEDVKNDIAIIIFKRNKSLSCRSWKLISITMLSYCEGRLSPTAVVHFLAVSYETSRSGNSEIRHWTPWILIR